MGGKAQVGNYSKTVLKVTGLKKLVIISHTEHQLHPQLGPVGWGPTIREINFLAQYWDEVIHVACFEKTSFLGSSLPYTKNNIRFIPIPSFGGVRWWQKMDIFLKAPRVLFIVNNALNGATEVQLRLPMSMGVFLIPYFKWFAKRTFRLWVKYANNWGKPSNAISYRWQQQWLNNNWLDCPVTINGAWPNQPSHCKTFENPCITNAQLNEGTLAVNNKNLAPPYTFIFIGRVDQEKGVDLLISSLFQWPQEIIAKIHIVGEGPLLDPLKNQLSRLRFNFECHGNITQQDIFRLLSESHFLVLPSKSEGFPKVVAEALNFGCIPIVSSVGSIPYYIIHKKNGIIMSEMSSKALTKAIAFASNIKEVEFTQIISEGRKLSSKFTFESYFELLKKEVLIAS